MAIFTSMEIIGILNPLSESDLWCPHYCFQELIHQKLIEWLDAWIRHPLSSKHNLSPIQLWVEGRFENASFEQMVSDDYGID